jgi:hypothetical protein
MRSGLARKIPGGVGSPDPPLEEDDVNTYVILRRSGWRSAEEVRWIRSYVLEQDGGSVGTVCIYQAVSPEAIREHASRAVLPVDEIIPVAETVLVRPDPEPAQV